MEVNPVIEDVYLEFDDNGVLKKITPDLPTNYYLARFYIIQGKQYDLHKLEDLKKIPELYCRFSGNTFSDVTKQLEYILRMKAGDLHTRGLYEEAFACYKKSNKLMYQSNLLWNEDDFLRVFWCMLEFGKFDEAYAEKSFIEEHYKDKYDITILHKKAIEKILINCAKLGTDLVEIGNAGNIVDADTAIFRKRFYSVSGNDKRVPQLTENVLRCIPLIPYPYIEGISRPTFCCPQDWLIYSNRPFIDDRTDEEIMLYENWKTEMRLKKRRDIGREEYYRIKYGLPEFAPKSFNAYSRMKNSESDKFWELVEKAADLGIKIEV